MLTTHLSSPTKVVKTFARICPVLALAAVALALIAPAGASAAADPSTPVQASAAQVARFLFVAGDVGRLTQIPSGTENVVLEKVLQQLYTENPTLASSRAVSDIQGLQAVLSSGAKDISPATLTVMSANQRILTILNALSASTQPSDVQRALAQVTAHELGDSAQSTAGVVNRPFDPSVDSLSTISYTTFSPARTLDDTAALAAGDNAFGQARDTLWQQVSHESVFDNTQTLLGENPALQNNAIQGFVGLLATDGSLSTTVGHLQSMIQGGITQVGDQNCTPDGSGCSSGALHDAQVATQACQGSGSSSAACTNARNTTVSDGSAAVAAIAAQRSATSAEALAIGGADPATQELELAEGQAASDLADEENQAEVFAVSQQTEKTIFDSINLASTLFLAEVDPVAAVGAILNLTGDVTGFTFPDPASQTLQGLETISKQLASFEQFTATAFGQLDDRLSALSTQVDSLVASLSTQLGDIHTQLTTLTGDVSQLQESVDRLQSEVQSLFASSAENTFDQETNQFLGYAQRNGGHRLEQGPFSTAASDFYTDATSAAVREPEVTDPTGKFTADGVNSLLTGNSPDVLNTSINLFNAFPGQVTDAGSGSGWPDASQILSGSLSPSACGTTSASGLLCLPNPAVWAGSARAYAQLLAENPQWVTSGPGSYLDWLSQITAEGQAIKNAVARVSSNDAGSDPAGTGNKLLDSALNYYTYWGGDFVAHPANALPSLSQAIENEQQHYLQTHFVPNNNNTTSYTGVNPWGGASQSPDLSTLQQMPQFTNVPYCSFGGPWPSNPAAYSLPKLPTALISFLPTPVLNAVRLGIGNLSVCWDANFFNETGGGSGPDQLQGQLSMDIEYTYSYNGKSFAASATGYTQASDCTNDGDSNDQQQAADNILRNWPGGPQDSSCADMASVLTSYNNLVNDKVNENLQYQLQNDLNGTIGQQLAGLQGQLYKDIVVSGTNGTTLTAGEDGNTDVAAAAQRLAGANSLLNGYISLGLPQTLASDDTLHSLVLGQNADAFIGQGNVLGAAPASSITQQVVNYYLAAETAMPSFDPGLSLSGLVYQHQSDLQAALRADIVPSAGSNQAVRAETGQRAAAAQVGQAGSLAESDSVIGSTLDRLNITAAALHEAMGTGELLTVSVAGSGSGSVAGGGISCPGTCSNSYPSSTGSVTLTPTASPGSTFAGWSGACTGTGPCTLPIGLYDQAVTATFVPASSSSATGGSVTPQPGPTTQPGSTPRPGSPAVVQCTLAPTSAKVLLHAASTRRRGGKGKPTVQPGTVSLAVSCNQNAKVALTGTLSEVLVSRGTRTAHAKRHVVHYRLGPARASAKAGHRLTLTIKLPAAALRALANKTSESATFTLAAVNGAGTRKATTTITKLMPR